MTPWWQGRLVAFDIESTDANPETARIVTAAVAAVGAGLATETLTLMAAPDVEISEGASAVHGITNEMARADGAPPAEVVSAVLCALAAYLQDGSPLCCYNARFDVTILDREARRYGLVPLQDRVRLRVIDGFVLDKHIDRFRRGSRKLDAVCEHWGASLDGAHDAAHDAIAAARVAWCIGARGEIVRRVRNAADGRDLARLKAEWERVRSDLDALHAAQVRWARDQAEGLRDYFVGKGELETAAGVRFDWPLVPLPAERAAA